MIRECLECGKYFTIREEKSRVFYCSSDCLEKAKERNIDMQREEDNEYIKKAYNAVTPRTKLDRLVQEAEKAGLSYGEYIARRYMQNEKNSR